MSPSPLVDGTLVAEVKQLIQSARQRAVAAVNAELTLLYWQVGKRIADEVLGGERAEYGKQVIAGLAEQMTLDYGKSWSKRNLAQMVKFSEVFPDVQIVQTLSAQLSWSHCQMRWAQRILNTLFEEHRNDAYMLDNSWA
ncbi:DUF1016 N-terminal domain-containing protein [Methylobacter psychrophilus]|uniref:DUF1016 N-terminal domain-containing protein n=1 Tax=Methylobacter psychrophilus TaxID=96941 RepID=UPI0021D50FD7|nr:DUF1016 N-terminal domain-containing protein [Methylobacter psychrophilus]